MTITGTRSTGHREPAYCRSLFETFIAPFARAGTRFHLGGAAGIDSLALLWLADDSEAELVVAVPAKIADQPADARHAIEAARAAGRLTEVVELDGEIGTPGYHARNRWMVDRSEFVIGFPRQGAAGGGTWYTLDYAASQGKPRLVVPVM